MGSLVTCLFAVVFGMAAHHEPGGDGSVQRALSALEAVFGPPSASGFGSAVFRVSGVAEDEVELAALGTYRNFLGNQWLRREAAWRGGFRRLYARKDTEHPGVIAELTAAQDPALRSVLELMLDDKDELPAARTALSGAFDHSQVRLLHLYALGDGEQYSGIEIAARYVSGAAAFLILLLD